MAQVLFASGKQAKFDGLASKDLNTLYFIDDTGRIYKGDKLIADKSIPNVVFTSAVPDPTTAEAGILYVVTTADGTSIYTKNGETLEQVGGGEVTTDDIADGSITFDKFATGTVVTAIGDTPTDSTIPTAKAVADAIKAAVDNIDLTEYDEAITGVTAAPVTADGETGTILTFTRKSGSNPIEVKVGDLFLSAASYDSTTHLLTLTVGTGESASNVTVDLEALIPEAVSTSDVAVSKDIKVTVDVGNYKKGDTISATDLNLQSFLENMLSQDSNPVATQPSITATLANAGAKEVGTQFTPSYTTSFNAGKYVANGTTQASGVTATSYAISDTNSNSATTANGTLPAFTVEPSTNYKVTATVNYGDGAIPKTYLGKDYPAAQIKAGSKSATTSAVTGFRAVFYGYKNASSIIADPTAITSNQIRALTVAQNFPASIATNQMQQMFFAAPKGKYSTLAVANSVNGAPQTVTKITDVMVNGANNYAAAAYDVFYVSNASADSGSNTYTLKFS